MKNHYRTDMCVIGFALFSMFFGAGNVIFPPYLGMESGPEWITGFISYYIADIGLALAAMCAIFRKGSAHKALSGAGSIPAEIMMCAIVLCLGPMFAIPRTAAMTFEMAAVPVLGNMSSIVFSVCFFAVVFLCAVRENAVVDIVGKIMTPALLCGLAILIVKGIVSTSADIRNTPYISNVMREGIGAGYQTMDVLATMLFGGIILKSAENKGYTLYKDKIRTAAGASVIACVLLFIVYGGLSYLGASVSAEYSPEIGRSALMTAIVSGLLGKTGTAVFSVIVGLACMTTAVGLVSSVSKYFSELFKGRIRYGVFTALTCFFSAIVSNAGLEQIIAIAGPVLDIVYPPVLILIASAFIPGLNGTAVKAAAGAGLVYGIIAVSGSAKMIVDMMPFAHMGFGWILPVIVCGIAACCFEKYILKRNADK